MRWMFSLFLIFALQCVSVFAGIEQYFKRAEGKAGYHSMRNVDFIYVINLDKRPEKFSWCQDQLARFGIIPYRFSAVNGWELPLDVINDVGLKLTSEMDTGQWGTCYFPEKNGEPSHEVVHQVGRTYFCHCMSRGAVAIVLSHLSVLQDAYDAGYQTIWVMEDDIEIIRHPLFISDMVEELDRTVGKNNWDVLFTDRDTKNQQGEYIPCTAHAWRPNFRPPDPKVFKTRRDIGPRLQQVGARYGAYSMIVRRSGMKKILDFIKQHKIFLPYDMDFYLNPAIRMYAVKQDIVSTLPQAASDNGGANYKK